MLAAGVSHDFEYVYIKGETLVTRSTSRNLYKFNMQPGRIVVSYNEPSIQSKLIELHKGHGPEIFRTFQKAIAVGLVFAVLSGFWLGLSALGLGRNTPIITGAGVITLGFLALF